MNTAKGGGIYNNGVLIMKASNLTNNNATAQAATVSET
jgi:hypothetical protein